MARFGSIFPVVAPLFDEKEGYRYLTNEFYALPATLDLPALEAEVLDFWQRDQVFAQSVAKNPEQQENGKSNAFVFYDGPPFANGLPHYGHLLTGYVKDIIARYQTMRGKRVERRFGWDCHGLPAEMAAEQELGIHGHAAIHAYGIEPFNAACERSVLRYTDAWEAYIQRQGRWVDTKDAYRTMDRSYMESVLWAFKTLHDKGLLYESMRVMPYSWACETPLSQFETRLDNSYRPRTDKTVTVGFDLTQPPPGAPTGHVRYRLLAWTTTPWTLPSNLALAVGPDLTYAYVPQGDVCYIVAAARAAMLLPDHAIVCTVLGAALVGASYHPLFPYFSGHAGAFRVLGGGFVTDEDGTGVVHLAPGFGEDDHALCTQEGIALVCPVDREGAFTEELQELSLPQGQTLTLAGRLVFDTIEDIIRALKALGSWHSTGQIVHDYPHCWRTDTPLIYKAVPSWYVAVTAIRDRMVELNRDICWVPGHVQQGLFGKWLEQARDWSISRNRFWGTPIPVWKSDNPNNQKCYVYGSIEALEQDFGVPVPNLHRPFIDQLTRPDPEDPRYTLRRVPEVLDCWFESGSMPFAQVHYPFEREEWFKQHFPADFIVEYAAQTRGWFYTLMVLGTALFDRPPFKHCICHGVLLDGSGRKLSKRLNNYADPHVWFDHYGSDALRWLMAKSPVLRGEELLLEADGSGVRDVIRLVLNPLWHACHFFTLYARADNITAQFRSDAPHVLDHYILHHAHIMVEAVRHALDSYDLPAATVAIETFIDVLTNWYIRRSRSRFWSSECTEDKQAAYDTLYTVLHILCRTAAPLLPCLTEKLYAALTQGGTYSAAGSVHLAEFPTRRIMKEAEKFAVAGQPEGIEHPMDRVREVCTAALSVRSAHNLRVRQPLARLTLYGPGTQGLEEFFDIIQDEVNVKEVVHAPSVQEVANYTLDLNFSVLGKRLKAQGLEGQMKPLIGLAKQGAYRLVEPGVIAIGSLEITEASKEYTLALKPKDPTTTAALHSKDGLVVLDLTLTQPLIQEGHARDIVRTIQQSRKEANLGLQDRIEVYIDISAQEVHTSAVYWQAYIAEQVLASAIHFGPKPEGYTGLVVSII